MDLDSIGEFARRAGRSTSHRSSGPGKPSSSRRRSRRRGTAAVRRRAADGRHRTPVLPDGQDRHRAGHVAGVYDTARVNGGIVYQGAPYEGLTCDFLEIAWAAGGGTCAERQDVGDRLAREPPRPAVHGRRDPQRCGALAGDGHGRVRIAHVLLHRRSRVHARLALRLQGRRPALEHRESSTSFRCRPSRAAVVPAPRWPRPRDFGVRKESAWRGAGRRLPDVTERASARCDTCERPTRAVGGLQRPAVEEALPYAGVLKQAIEVARARPVTPDYHDISAAIYTNVNAALNGAASPAAALKAADRQINAALRRK